MLNDSWVIGSNQGILPDSGQVLSRESDIFPPRTQREETVEGRSHLMAQHSQLIEDCADLIVKMMAKIGKVVTPTQYVMRKINESKVDYTGRLMDGSVEFGVLISSWMTNRKGAMEVEIPVEDGELVEPDSFTTSVGKLFPFTNEGVKKAFSLPKQRIMHKRRPTLERALLVDAAKRTANDPIQKKIDMNGMEVWVEWPKGSTRKYESGFESKMYADYGYIPDTKGSDGEEADVYVGPDQSSTIAFRVTQLKDSGDYDEDKYMLGFTDEATAKAMYLQHMPPNKLGAIDKLSWDEFVSEVADQEVKASNDLVSLSIDKLS